MSKRKTKTTEAEPTEETGPTVVNNQWSDFEQGEIYRPAAKVRGRSTPNPTPQEES